MEPAAFPTPSCVAVPPAVVNAASPEALEVDVPPKPEVRIFAFLVRPNLAPSASAKLSLQ